MAGIQAVDPPKPRMVWFELPKSMVAVLVTGGGGEVTELDPPPPHPARERVTRTRKADMNLRILVFS